MAGLPLADPLPPVSSMPLDDPEEGNVTWPELGEDPELPEPDDPWGCPELAPEVAPDEVGLATFPLVVLLQP
jgi:hypothetical protein